MREVVMQVKITLVKQIYYIKILLLAACLTLFISCASVLKQNPKEMEKSYSITSLSKESFQRVEPILQKLKPGDPIDSSGLDWNIIDVYDGKTVNQISVSNGWIGGMSGKLQGGRTKLGAYMNNSDKSVYGYHTYGYLWQKVIIIPQYEVKTEATLINKSDYDELKKSDTKNIGSYKINDEMSSELFFKDLHVKEIINLSITEPSTEAWVQGKLPKDPFSLPFFVLSQSSKNDFNQTEVILTQQVKEGMGVYEFTKLMNCIYFSDNPGDYGVLIIKGYLNYKGDFRWAKITHGDQYSIWPFGYIDGKKEVPLIDVIWKNGYVIKVAPHVQIKELENQLTR
jgi:hypothetical protein